MAGMGRRCVAGFSTSPARLRRAIAGNATYPWPRRASAPNLHHPTQRGCHGRQRGIDLGCRSTIRGPGPASLGMLGARGKRRQVHMTREAGFKRRVRARMAKTGEAYSTARALLDSGAAGDPEARVLHVTNGDSVTGTLREARLPGRV